MLRTIALCLAVLGAVPAAAGESSQSQAAALPAPQTQALSRSLEESLARQGVHVALVGRLARDRASLPEGVRYTHMGFWVYSEITGADGQVTRGYRVYNLYQRASQATRSDLVEESPEAFFAGATQLDAGVIVPSRRMQGRLLAAIAGPTFARVHNPNYSLLSNPNTDVYQNCTEHVLNVVYAAILGTDDMGRIKTEIARSYRAQEIKLNPLVRAFGPAFSQGVRLDDQTGRLRSATFSSIARFMDRNDLTEALYRHTLEGAKQL